MIIKAKHNFVIYNFMKFYTWYKIGRNFNKVCISGNYYEKDMPVLLLSNHVSWWDGFWAMYLNMKLFRRKFHFMMLESQLKKYWFFRYSGGFSVKKNSRSVLESLDYSSKILENKNNLLLLFPQGQIHSLYTSYLRFERGVERFLVPLKGKVQIIFNASMIDYHSSPDPTLTLYIMEYEDAGTEIEKIEQEYNVFYTCLTWVIRCLN